MLSYHELEVDQQKPKGCIGGSNILCKTYVAGISTLLEVQSRELIVDHLLVDDVSVTEDCPDDFHILLATYLR